MNPTGQPTIYLGLVTRPAVLKSSRNITQNSIYHIKSSLYVANIVSTIV